MSSISRRPVITALDNTTYSFIRYDIGDHGSPVQEPCRRGLPFAAMHWGLGKVINSLPSMGAAHVWELGRRSTARRDRRLDSLDSLREASVRRLRGRPSALRLRPALTVPTTRHPDAAWLRRRPS